MSTFKDALCLLAIFIAYGITGHMDYEDATMLEEALRQMPQAPPSDCRPALTPPTAKPAAQARYPSHDPTPDPASDASPDGNALCPPIID